MWEDMKLMWGDLPKGFRWLLKGVAGVCLLLLLIQLASCTPDARAATLDDLAIELLDDSVRVTVGHTVDPRADSATVKVTIGTASQTKRAGANSTAFTFAAPAEGATVTIAAQVCAYRAPLAPQCVGKNRSWTRPVGPLDPPVIDTIDVGQLIGAAPVLDSVQLVRVTGETCEIERRDYYGHELLIVLDSAAEAAGCEVGLMRRVYSGGIYPALSAHNAHIIQRADEVYTSIELPRLQARWDSMLTGLLPPEPRWCGLCAHEVAVAEPPVLADTFVARPRGSTAPELIAIAEYRESHPGFTWP